MALGAMDPSSNLGCPIKENFEHLVICPQFQALVDGRKGRCKRVEILRGLVYPEECPLFGKACTPRHPGWTLYGLTRRGL